MFINNIQIINYITFWHYFGKICNDMDCNCIDCCMSDSMVCNGSMASELCIQVNNIPVGFHGCSHYFINPCISDRYTAKVGKQLQLIRSML